MFKKIGYILVIPATLALLLFAMGCDDDDDHVYAGDDIVTFVNEYGEAILIQPFGTVLDHGDAVDFDINGDIVHVVVFRNFDGVVLLDTDVEGGDVWVIQ